jgi:uncharacterized protein YcbX
MLQLGFGVSAAAALYGSRARALGEDAVLRRADTALRDAQRKSKPSDVKVCELYYYPVKSCAGIKTDELAYDKNGFLNDRRWAIVDEKSSLNSCGQPKEQEALPVITSRKFPKMALIQPTCSPNGNGLLLEFPGMQPLPLKEWNESKAVSVELWTVCGQGKDCGDAAARWICAVLGAKGLRLVHFEPEVCSGRNPRDEATWNTIYPEGTSLGFADSVDCVIMNEKSLDDLRQRLPPTCAMASSPVLVERFRPNIVVTGTSFAYEEDLWKHIQVGGNWLTMARHCNRCAVTMVDTSSGRAQIGEPLKTLRKYRLFNHLWNSDRRHKKAPLLGVKYCFDVPSGGEKHGTIKLGDALDVHEYRAEGDRCY